MLKYSEMTPHSHSSYTGMFLYHKDDSPFCEKRLIWVQNSSTSSSGLPENEKKLSEEALERKRKQEEKIRAEEEAREYIAKAQHHLLSPGDRLAIRSIDKTLLSPEIRAKLEPLLTSDEEKNEILALIEKNPKDISPIYQKLLSVSPKTLLEESNWDAVERKKYLRRYFELLFNFVTKSDSPQIQLEVRTFIQHHFSADLLQSIPNTARESAAKLQIWAKNMDIEEAKEEASATYTDTATQGGNMMGEKNLALEEEQSSPKTTPEEMLQKIALLKDPELLQKAQKMVASEQTETRDQQRKMMEKLARLVFEEIAHNTEQALKEGEKKLGEVWEQVSEFLNTLLPAIGKAAAQDNPENSKEWEKATLSVFRQKAKRIQHLLSLAREGTEEEILQSIQRDLNHSAESEATLEKEGKAQDKIKKRHHHLGLATDATQTHLHKQNEEIPVLHAKIANDSADRFFASQNADTNEKFGLETSPEEEDTQQTSEQTNAPGGGEKREEQTKTPILNIVSSEHSDDSETPKDTPKAYELPFVQQWAEETGISKETAADLIKSLSSLSLANPLHQKKFFFLACQKHPELRSLSEAEQEELFHAFCAHELTAPLAEAGGDLRRYALLAAAQEMESLARSSIENAVDGMNGNDIREEGISDPREELGISPKDLEAVLEKIEHLSPEGFSEDVRQIIKNVKSATEFLKVRPEEFQEVMRNIADSDLPIVTANLEAMKRLLRSLFRASDEEADEETPLFQKQVQQEAEKNGISIEKARQNVQNRIKNIRQHPTQELLAERLQAGLHSLAKEREQRTVSLHSEEKEHLREKGENIRKGFQTLLSWGLEEYPNEQEVSQIREIKNLAGKNIIQAVQDDFFETEYSKETLAIFHVPQKDDCHIFLRQSDYRILFDEQNANPQRKRILLQALSHEITHLADFSGKTQFSAQLFRDLQKTPGGKELIQQFSEKLGKNHKNWEKLWKDNIFGNKEEIQTELLAHLLSGNTDADMNNILSAIRNTLGEDYVKKLREDMQQSIQTLEPENLEKGLLSASNTQSSDGSNAESEMQMGQVGYPRFEFDQRKNSILRKLADIENEKGANVVGKDEYAQNVRERLEKLEEYMNQPDVDIAPTLQEVVDLEKEVNGALGTIADAQKPQEGFLSDLWNNTTFLSFADLGRMWETTKEFTKRKYERNSKYRSGVVGNAIFNKLSRGLAGEFNTNIQNAEADEVNNYKKAIDQMDPWQTMDRLTVSRNKDEIKACLLRLSELGAIDWTDERIWRALEGWQNVARFVPSDADNQISLRAKLNRACGAIWDADFFSSTERKNKSSIESKKGEYTDLASGDLDYGGSIADMLVKRASGENIDPIRYYAYVGLDIAASNNDPVLIFWNLIQGVRYGLLTIDNIKKIEGSNQNQYAPIRWFSQVKANSSYLSEIGKVFSVPDKPGKMPGNFQEWFYTHVMTLADIRERITKSAATGGWDHDMAVMQGAIGNANTAKTHFSTVNTGKPQHDPTAYPNMMVGMLINVTSMARRQEEFSSEKELFDMFAEHVEYATSFIAYGTGRMFNNSITYGKEKFHTLGPTELHGRARMSSCYGGKRAQEGSVGTGQQFLNRHEEILKATGIDFLRLLDTVTTNAQDEKQNASNFLDYIDTIMPGAVDGEVRRRSIDKEGVLQSIGQMLRNYYANNPTGARQMMQGAFSMAQSIYSNDHEGQGNITEFPYDENTPSKPPNLYGSVA